MVNKDVLESPLGMMGWYPNDKKLLDKTLDAYLDQAKPDLLEDIQAFILPHAGYRYSGSVAAVGIKQILGKSYKRVVIMGPSHQVYLPNKASVPDVTHYKTPLGEIALDTDFIEKLKKHSVFTTQISAHKGEHSVQIQIPFLQKALKSWKAVPIVVGDLDEFHTIEMARILRSLIDKDTLIVVSSDFVHYGERFGFLPFNRNIPENLEEMDMMAFKYIKKLDSSGFRSMCQQTGATICGKNPIGVLLALLPDNSKATLLKYDTSGNLTGEWDNSVSYMSVAFSGKWGAKTIGGNMKEEKKELNDFLTSEEKEALLKLARKTIVYYLSTNKAPKVDDLGIGVTAGMSNVMGAFVTLHKNGGLRGCIGEILPKRPLYQVVIDQAINATVNDYRFSQVTKEEVSSLEIEISALTPPQPVNSYKEVIIGKHGVILQKSGRSAVFLPQVAPEQGWSLEETLSHLAMKAGLAGNDWKSGTQFFVFEAIVFSE